MHAVVFMLPVAIGYIILPVWVRLGHFSVNCIMLDKMVYIEHLTQPFEIITHIYSHSFYMQW